MIEETTAVYITIPGKPVAKNRPRFAKRGKFVTTYSDQETEESKFYMLAREQVLKQIKNPLTGPIIVRAIFSFERPKSHYGTGKNAEILKPSALKSYEHTGKPDVDNCIKFALDCLNGLAWADDKQIVSIRIDKQWVQGPGVSRFGIWTMIPGYNDTGANVETHDQRWREVFLKP